MREIGGYFELELRKGNSYYLDAIALNSARNCLRYLIRAHNISKIQIPAYTCPVVWQALEDENCEYEFYEINENLLPSKELDKNTFILYNNYFGVCDSKVNYMSLKYPNIIIDNSQAFYSQKREQNNFCSPRKFFGVPDGGYVYSTNNIEETFIRDTSINRMSHLIKRIEFGANAGYDNFKKNDASLNHADIMRISLTSEKILESIEYDKCKFQRRKNFQFLHEHLNLNNVLNLQLEECIVPMIYPYLPQYGGENLKKKCIEKGIFVATYWPGQKDTNFGSILENELLAIPIDQRYSIDEMTYILEVLDE